MAPSVLWQGPFQQSLISLNAISRGRGWANGPLRAHLFEAIILSRPLFRSRALPWQTARLCRVWRRMHLSEGHEELETRMKLISRRQSGNPQTSVQCTLVSTNDRSTGGQCHPTGKKVPNTLRLNRFYCDGSPAIILCF